MSAFTLDSLRLLVVRSLAWSGNKTEEKIGIGVGFNGSVRHVHDLIRIRGYLLQLHQCDSG